MATTADSLFKFLTSLAAFYVSLHSTNFLSHDRNILHQNIYEHILYFCSREENLQTVGSIK